MLVAPPAVSQAALCNERCKDSIAGISGTSMRLGAKCVTCEYRQRRRRYSGILATVF